MSWFQIVFAGIEVLELEELLVFCKREQPVLFFHANKAAVSINNAFAGDKLNRVVIFATGSGLKVRVAIDFVHMEAWEHSGRHCSIAKMGV